MANSVSEWTDKLLICSAARSFARVVVPQK
jgi:hypothetical protein